VSRIAAASVLGVLIVAVPLPLLADPIGPARSVAPFAASLQRQGHSAAQNAQRAALYQALALLPQDLQDRMRNIELIGDRNFPTDAEGFVLPNDSENIYLPAWSSSYQGASKGHRDALHRLASILVHELHHLEHGPDEGSAYKAQLDILRRLNAPKSVMEDVARNRDLVAPAAPGVSSAFLQSDREPHMPVVTKKSILPNFGFASGRLKARPGS